MNSSMDLDTGRTIDQTDDRDSSSASSASSAGTVVPSHSAHLQPLATTWTQYFDQELYLQRNGITHHVYLTPPKDASKDPLFVCHHGAGSSGLSFAVFATEMKRKMPAAGVLSIDARGHGLTTTPDPITNQDLALSTLAEDLEQTINLTQDRLTWKVLPSMCFIGHSLGGAVVTQVAKSGTYGAKLVGFGVIDVVEGSALEYVKSMQAILANRPSSFDSVESAIEWHTRSRTIRNHASAAVSTPSLLHQTPTGKWTWKTDLAATKPYWEAWFAGMSKNFLAGKAAKLLLLAGTDRLDKELMIGQMQGKFQLQVFPEAGHFVQEDLPDQTAELVVEFFKRNDRSTLVLPPKVSDLIAQGKKV